MAATKEPLLYLRKFLLIEEDLKSGGVKPVKGNPAAKVEE